MESVQTTIKTEHLLALAANALHDLFIKAKSDLAKNHFKALSKHKSAVLGNLETDDDVQILVRLALDSSQYVGKLNYQTFRKFVDIFLQQVTKTLDQNTKVPIRNDKSGTRFLFEIPAPMMEGKTLNVMMVGLSTAVEGELELQVMFMDPEQFKRKPA